MTSDADDVAADSAPLKPPSICGFFFSFQFQSTLEHVGGAFSSPHSALSRALGEINKKTLQTSGHSGRLSVGVKCEDIRALRIG